MLLDTELATEASRYTKDAYNWPASDFDYLKKHLGKPAPGFPNDLIRWKVALIGRWMREVGDAYTDAKGVEFENALTRDTLKEAYTAYLNGLPLVIPFPGARMALCTAPEGRKRHSRGKPSVGLGNESDDAYPGTLFEVANRWRLIVCRDRLQYILQHRNSPTAPRSWRAKSYPTTREGVRDSITRHVGAYAAEALAAEIDALPDHIRD